MCVQGSRAGHLSVRDDQRTLIAYELDRLLRAERGAPSGELTYG